MASTHRKAAGAKSAHVSTLNTKLTPDDMRGWQEAVQDVHMVDIETVPAGWYPATELADIFGCGEAQTYRRLTRLIKTGRAEVKKFMVPRGSKCYPVPHYKLK